MFIKNITYVVPLSLASDFERVAFQATDEISSWVSDIKLFKIKEQVDADSYNYTIQLFFDAEAMLIPFNHLAFENFTKRMQSEFKEPLLFFDSHMQKIF